MAAPVEEAAMRRAIAISCAGLGTTSPNPPVGCVILDRDGRLAGEGYHQRAGEAHAEVHALTAAGDRAAGGTAVVTLEPCNHHGRTPPCRQALTDAAVARVVIGIMDPTSQAGGGAAALRRAGVEVEQGVLAGEATLVLGPWLHALRERRPLVTWVHRSPAGPVWDLADARQLRISADAVLAGDRSLEEGLPGSHGAGALTLPGLPLPPDPSVALEELHGGGVRTLLLDGDAATAGPFLDALLVDHIVVYLASHGASHRPDSIGSAPGVLPPGFRLSRTARVAGAIRIDGART